MHPVECIFAVTCTATGDYKAAHQAAAQALIPTSLASLYPTLSLSLSRTYALTSLPQKQFAYIQDFLDQFAAGHRPIVPAVAAGDHFIVISSYQNLQYQRHILIMDNT